MNERKANRKKERLKAVLFFLLLSLLTAGILVYDSNLDWFSDRLVLRYLLAVADVLILAGLLIIFFSSEIFNRLLSKIPKPKK